MDSQREARLAAAKQRWDSFPADLRLKLGELYAAVDDRGSWQKLQAWWAQNQASLGRLGITPDAPLSVYGSTALFCSSFYGHTESVPYLVDVCGANIDLKGGYNGWTPLIGAAFENQPDSVRVLLERGANPDLRDDDDKTALEWAREKNHKECIDLLEQWVPAPTVKSALKG